MLVLIHSIGTKTVATTDLIPSLTGYATIDQLPDMQLYPRLSGPNFSGTPTILSKPILAQDTSCLPAWYYR